MYPMLMKPSFKDYLWGGEKLRNIFGKESALSPLAESWEISCHEDGLSYVSNGEFSGEALSAVLKRYPEMLGEKCSGGMPVLAKLIDAEQSLSLQVHPDDGYAHRVEGQSGKNEMWYIVDCDEGAELILGFNKPLNREQLEKSINDGSIMEHANRVWVEKGDCFMIPAGMLHAIGAGIVIAEVQQSSNVTYRVYDYGRKGADGSTRELHIEKALDVTDTSLKGEKSSFPQRVFDGYTLRMLCDWPYFKAELINISSKAMLTAGSESFTGIMCVGGELSVAHDGKAYELAAGSSAFIPAGIGDYELVGSGSALMIRCM